VDDEWAVIGVGVGNVGVVSMSSKVENLFLTHSPIIYTTLLLSAP